MSNNIYFPALTSLRIFAALLVFFYHLFPTFKDSPLFINAIFRQGHIGVNIFFALSGFLITIRYIDSMKDGFGYKSYLDYFIKRLARIYPLYICILILTYILSPGAMAKQIEAVLSHLSLTQSYFDKFKFTGIIPAWTLGVEMAFYLIAPFIFWSFGFIQRRFKWSTMRSGGILTMLWTGTFLLGGYFLIFLSNEVLDNNPKEFMLDSKLMLFYTIFGQLFNFLVGMLTALLVREYPNLIQNNRVSKLALAIGLGGLILLIYSLQATYRMDNSPARLLTFFVPIATSILMLALMNPSNKLAQLMSKRTLVYGGTISYALYLIHMTPLLDPFKQLTSLEFSPWMNITILLLGALILSSLFYEYVEKRGQNLMLSLWQKL